MSRKYGVFSQIPLLGMGYINNMLHYGLEKFVIDFKAAGLDGLIIPDLPHEEAAAMTAICRANDLHLIEFVTPNTVPARITTDVFKCYGLYLLRLGQRRNRCAEN